MVSLARRGYSHEAVLQMLQSDRQINFRYELLDRGERKLRELDYVSGAIHFDSSQEIMGTATFKIKEDYGVDFKSVDLRIRPVFMLKSPLGWLEYPLGIYIMASPERSQEGHVVYQDIDCYDYGTILKEDRITSRLFIPVGTNYVRQVRSIINGVGIQKINVQTSELSTREELEFEVGTSNLEIVNSLLTAINYEPIHFDGNGYAVSRKYIEPVNRRTEQAYRTDENSVIREGTKQSIDTYNVPNIFIRYTDGPDGEELKSIYVNDKVGNPLSTTGRGRNVVDVESVNDVADQDTLDKLVRRIAIEKSQIYDTVYLKTALMPNHAYRDCIFVNDTALGVGNKYIEYAWDMTLEIGGIMSHTLKKAVKL